MNPSHKRAWTAVELSVPDIPRSRQRLTSVEEDPQQTALNGGRGAANDSPENSSKSSTTPPGPIPLPQDLDLVGITSRKSTACPACRKQKTKCIMENDMPPCKRCAERGLTCSPNKTVQDIMAEQARWNARMMEHINVLQTALNEARAALSLPQISVMDGPAAAEKDTRASQAETTEDDLNSNEENLAPDTLATAPIRSLYEVTKPSVSHERDHTRFSGLVMEPDFITRGIITEAEADRFTKSYIGHLDHFFYGHLQKYSNLTEIRKTSTLLALTQCTVAALHDPNGTEAYDKLSRELRNVTSGLLFRTRLGLEDIKAFCMASYWLGDMTWILSAVVVRKAIAMHYHTSHLNQPRTDREGFYRSQMWLLIYLANEQISLLRGAPTCGVSRDFINCETHLSSPYAGEVDRRLISHIDLLILLNRVRETYGVDTLKPIPFSLIPQLREYLLELERWGNKWSGRLARNHWLGSFPSQAVQLHWRFAKFFLCTLAYRGLNVESTTMTLSRELEDIAANAITTALSILQMLIDSDELRAYLVGIPHYFHTMFAFAAVFLLKVATRYKQHVRVDLDIVFGTNKKVLQIFQNCPCAKQHLVNRIAQGLKEMIDRCEKQIAAEQNRSQTIMAGGRMVPAHHPVGPSSASANDSIGSSNFSMMDAAPDIVPQDMARWLDLENFDFLSMSPPLWQTEFEL
ncbi:hypothetical protein VTO42DRAFT_3269 [Malbranchea cinnamomea]